MSAIALVVRKQSGANTVEVARTVRRAVAELSAKLPRGAKLTVPTDNATFIESSIRDVQFDLLYHLMSHPGQVFSPLRLLHEVWDYPSDAGSPDLAGICQ